MKKPFTLSIPQPCGEKFDQFQKTHTGGFCQSCQKEVIDFTQKSEKEIVAYFKEASGSTCGRFRENQLKGYTPNLSSSLKLKISYLGASILSMSLLSFFSVQPSQAQIKPASTQNPVKHSDDSIKNKKGHLSNEIEYELRGQLIDAEDNLPAIGVTILLKGSSIGTISNADGYFEFPRKVKKGEVLLFQAVGYQTEEYTIPENSIPSMHIKIEMQSAILDVKEVIVVAGMVCVDPQEKKKKSKRSPRKKEK